MSAGLKGKTVLVTGGAGFIGSHITDRLLKEGATVKVLDNLVSGTLDNLKGALDKIEFIQKDLRDEAALDSALRGVDAVCHQAALRSVPKSVNDPLEYHDVNVTGTLRLFFKAKEKGITRISFASSSSVYGEREDFPERETDMPAPVSPYATTKLLGDYYGYLFSILYGLGVVSLRYFNVYGPRQSLEDEYAVVIPKFINCLLKDQSPPIYDDGDQERDFTFIDNVVEANILALTKEGVGGQAFNIANGRPNSVNQLLADLNGILGKNIKATYLPPRPGDVRKTEADVSKAKKMLGWKPAIGFKEGLERTVAYFKKVWG